MSDGEATAVPDAAMAVRNLGIAIVFTLGSSRPPLLGAAVPLGAIVIGSFVVAWLAADWTEAVDIDLESPFSLWNVLAFGAVFLVILVGGTVAKEQFGNVGFYVSALLSGLVSSAGTTTSAVLLYRQGSLGVTPAVVSILLATGSSILVKAGLAAAGPERFRNRVALWSVVLLVAAAVATAASFAIFT
ncbi:DUF4010 domain-containing protein, partial [Halobium palmae]